MRNLKTSGKNEPKKGEVQENGLKHEEIQICYNYIEVGVIEGRLYKEITKTMIQPEFISYT